MNVLRHDANDGIKPALLSSTVAEVQRHLMWYIWRWKRHSIVAHCGPLKTLGLFGGLDAKGW